MGVKRLDILIGIPIRISMEKNLRIVVLESPYDSWNEVLVGNLLKDLIGLKLRGYGCAYPYGVLPVDGADLISTHLAVCRVENDGYLKPLMAMRWTSLKKCRLHNYNFPGLSLLQQAKAPEHIHALEKIITQLDIKNADLFYAGSLSIDPLEKTGKEQSIFFRELLTLIYVEYQKQNESSQLLAGGTIRFKMDIWLAAIGHEPLHLQPIQVRHLANESVRVMYLTKFSFDALRMAKKWKHLWDNRQIIGQPSSALKKIG